MELMGNDIKTRKDGVGMLITALLLLVAWDADAVWEVGCGLGGGMQLCMDVDY
jgi:hypothetical protein